MIQAKHSFDDLITNSCVSAQIQPLLTWICKASNVLLCADGLMPNQLQKGEVHKIGFLLSLKLVWGLSYTLVNVGDTVFFHICLQCTSILFGWQYSNLNLLTPSASNSLFSWFEWQSYIFITCKMLLLTSNGLLIPLLAGSLASTVRTPCQGAFSNVPQKSRASCTAWGNVKAAAWPVHVVRHFSRVQTLTRPFAQIFVLSFKLPSGLLCYSKLQIQTLCALPSSTSFTLTYKTSAS